ncbi:PIG-L family deacetylase [Candidatus Woesearchaeota archaeon]|nr:MAG: PIG-L family deacetylase [Candidatus Woesearchaeota archaeon]
MPGKKQQSGKEAVLVICAHNDDQVIGCGGTMAKYALEGKKVHTLVFSYGEASHPWLKPEIVKDMRLKELIDSNKILGGASVKVYGLSEGKFPKEIQNKNIIAKLRSEISSKKPLRIFTHSPDDPHPDHRAVLRAVLDAVSGMENPPPVFTFSVWNPIRLKKRDSPKLVVDISKTFKTKLAAFRAHKSQKATWFTLIGTILARDFLNGIKHKTRFAEVFFKVK